jgi:hypothetical protein
LETITVFGNARDAQPGKETIAKESKKRRRSDDLTDHACDVVSGGRPRKKTKTEDRGSRKRGRDADYDSDVEGNGPPAKRVVFH